LACNSCRWPSAACPAAGWSRASAWSAATGPAPPAPPPAPTAAGPSAATAAPRSLPVRRAKAARRRRCPAPLGSVYLQHRARPHRRLRVVDGAAAPEPSEARAGRRRSVCLRRPGGPRAWAAGPRGRCCPCRQTHCAHSGALFRPPTSAATPTKSTRMQFRRGAAVGMRSGEGVRGKAWEALVWRLLGDQKHLARLHFEHGDCTVSTPGDRWPHSKAPVR
jgi:hypothetical protein